MKLFKRTLGLILIIVALAVVTSVVMYSPEYMIRILRYGESDINDISIFTDHKIESSSKPFKYSTAINEGIGEILIRDSGELSELLEQSSTTSFLVIQNNTLVYEKYFGQNDVSTLNTSFSSVKSIVSILVGIAIDEGYIVSEADSIELYLPEFKNTRFGKITIEELLRMRSSISYKEGPLWFGDDARTYYTPDLRKLALHSIKNDSEYEGNFHYNNYHPLLLGIILERSTGMSVSQYFEEKIWNKIGAEYSASWSLDSVESSFEKMESGLNFRSIDYAKIGSMLLNQGKWNSSTIVSEDWLNKSIYSSEEYEAQNYIGSFLEGRNTNYQYMWYSENDESKDGNYYAAGKYGQFIYISPESNIVIVRTGNNTGNIDWWPDILHEVSAKVNNKLGK